MEQKKRVYWRQLALLVGGVLIAITIYLSFSNETGPLHMANGDKYGHFLAYFTLMTWFGLVYPSFISCMTSAIVFSGMGIGIELLQRLTVTRAFELLDAVASVSGVLVALMVLLIGSNIFDSVFGERNARRRQS